MRNVHVNSIVALSVLWVLALPAHAEIYKWIDKDGSVKYTDTPPPAGAKSLSTIRKKPAPSSAATPAATTDGSSPAAVVTNPTQVNSGSEKTDASAKDLEKKKQEIEEVEKRNKAEKEAQAKQKQLNCAAARSNYQSYSQGGRIYKTNEKGERVYLGDKELADGAVQAKREIDQYCN